MFSQIRSVLDIGCAAGWFLDVVKEKLGKVKTVGVEPSPAVVGNISRAHQLYQIPAEKLDSIDGKYDLVTFWNVFEHFSDPHMILNLASKRLNPKGLLILSTPNRSGLISRLSYLLTWASGETVTFPLEELFQTDNAFGHLFHYHPRSMTTLLNRNGFKPLNWKRADIVDTQNVRQRLKVTSNQVDEIKQQVLAAGVAQLTRIARFLNLHDEMIVIARKA
jgi:2-polyprenyl-3-methyl-5-hydroxy-6-metoxy-1,4-benzoquinol methylase